MIPVMMKNDNSTNTFCGMVCRTDIDTDDNVDASGTDSSGSNNDNGGNFNESSANANAKVDSGGGL